MEIINNILAIVFFLFQTHLKLLRENVDLPVIPISAKVGTNVSTLLKEIRILYDNLKADQTEQA